MLSWQVGRVKITRVVDGFAGAGQGHAARHG
jgi:hypothetical protein